ncbi:hypothetical protein [Caproicibacter sp.]
MKIKSYKKDTPDFKKIQEALAAEWQEQLKNDSPESETTECIDSD